MKTVELGKAKVGPTESLFLVAEIGPTHSGLLSAKQLVDLAAASGFDAVKFQILDVERLVSDKNQLFEYQILTQIDPPEYRLKSEPLYDILQRRSLSNDEWKELAEYSKQKNLEFIATVSFKEQLELALDIGASAIKIASSDLDYLEILDLAAVSGVNVQIDTGSSSINEIETAIRRLESNGCSSIIIHQCPSGYPARLDSIHLNMIKTLQDRFSYPIAYSDHTPEVDMDIAAVALGVSLIEKTITLDRLTPSVEHCFSLDPSSTSEVKRRLTDVKTALGDFDREINDVVDQTRNMTRRGVYFSQPYPAGTPADSISVEFRRPRLNGISPLEWENLCKKRFHTTAHYPSMSLITRDMFTHE